MVPSIGTFSIIPFAMEPKRVRMVRNMSRTMRTSRAGRPGRSRRSHQSVCHLEASSWQGSVLHQHQYPRPTRMLSRNRHGRIPRPTRICSVAPATIPRPTRIPRCRFHATLPCTLLILDLVTLPNLRALLSVCAMTQRTKSGKSSLGRERAGSCGAGFIVHRLSFFFSSCCTRSRKLLDLVLREAGACARARMMQMVRVWALGGRSGETQSQTEIEHIQEKSDSEVRYPT